MNHDFYNDPRWKRKRETVLRLHDYKCKECNRYGKTTPANTVHHIIPLEWCLDFQPRLSLDTNNLYPLCDGCHNKMHDRVTNELTQTGIALMLRIWKKLPEGYPPSLSE